MREQLLQTDTPTAEVNIPRKTPVIIYHVRQTKVTVYKRIALKKPIALFKYAVCLVVRF